MADEDGNILATAEWSEGVYELKTTDSGLGGPPLRDGVNAASGDLNIPLQELTQRTNWLRNAIEMPGSAWDETLNIGHLKFGNDWILNFGRPPYFGGPVTFSLPFTSRVFAWSTGEASVEPLDASKTHLVQIGDITLTGFTFRVRTAGDLLPDESAWSFFVLGQ